MSQGDDIPWRNSTLLSVSSPRGWGFILGSANFRPLEPRGSSGINESEVGENPTLSRNCVEIVRFLSQVASLGYRSIRPRRKVGPLDELLECIQKSELFLPQALREFFYVPK